MRKYNNLHFLRALVFAVGGSFAQTEATWGHLRTMGYGAREGTQQYGVFAYEMAKDCTLHIAPLCHDSNDLAFIGIKDQGVVSWGDAVSIELPEKVNREAYEAEHGNQSDSAD